jgi:hypothetical protein
MTSWRYRMTPELWVLLAVGIARAAGTVVAALIRRRGDRDAP